MVKQQTILVVDDEPGIVESLAMTFEDDFEVITATAPEDALELLKEHDVAVIIADQRMPGMSGVDVLKSACKIRPDAVRIVLSAYAEMEDLIGAINAGEVWRYLVKPWEPHELRLTVSQAAERHQLIRDNKRLISELADANKNLKSDNEHLKKEIKKQYSFESLVGKSQQMEKVFSILQKVADSIITILILGETGTGKELVARAIHYNSARSSKKFVVQNCGALPDTLLESELFGHKKGAFTGAVSDKKGLFEEADGGTVFLDEIGETSPAMQIRLLRVLQEGEVKRVGELEPRYVDIRILAATNKNLDDMVKEGKFREDLLYRLNVMEVTVPPLRERSDDIPLLVKHFVNKAAQKFNMKAISVSDDAMKILKGYSYPGNVRELENEIERALMLADGNEIVEKDLSEKLKGGRTLDFDAKEIEGGLMEAVDHLKITMIKSALDKSDGNKTKAAEDIGLTRQSLQQMMKRLDME